MTRTRLRLRLVATVSLTLLLGALAAPASAAYPGSNGRIAFARGSSILSKTVSGSTTKTLATGVVTAPSYSKSGNKIVYLRGHADFGPGWVDVWTMNADGTGKRNLTKSPDKYSNPSYRPDGKAVIVTHYDGNPMGHRRLVTMNTDGTNRRAFAPGVTGSMEDGVYSPNGTRIAYAGSRSDGTTVIRTIAAGGAASTVKTLASTLTNAEAPDWSPDGKRLVFSRRVNNEWNIHRVNADGTTVRKLADYGPDKGAMDPVWSPDGTRIVFSKATFAPTATKPELWVMKPDGSGKGRTSSHGYQPTWQPR